MKEVSLSDVFPKLGELLEQGQFEFTEAEEENNRALNVYAMERKRDLEAKGWKVELFREEPFVTARDSLKYKVYLMIWEECGKKRKARIEEISKE